MNTAKESSNEELISRIIELEKQLRLNSIEESRRLYEILKEQQLAFESETAEAVMRLKQRLENEKDQELRELVEKERDFIVGKYQAGIEKMKALYDASIEEYDGDEREEATDKLESMQQRVEDDWRVLIEKKVAETVNEFSVELRQRMNELENLHNQIGRLLTQFKSQDAVLKELNKNQEFQKSFISLQSHIMKGSPLHEDVEHLVCFCDDSNS